MNKINEIINNLKIYKENMEIKCKQVGQNMIVVIDNEQYCKKMTETKDRDSLKNKVLLYNKKQSETLKNQILKIISPKVIEKEIKETKKKGIEKGIKKETKKITKLKGKVKEKKNDNLVTKVETEFKKGNFSQEEIERLEELLKKKKEAIKTEPKSEIAREDNNSNTHGRERNR